jgi:hypothetical protein
MNKMKILSTISLILAFSLIPNLFSIAEGLRPPDYENLKYGCYKRNVFDLWQAGTTHPASLFIFFHGGGFTSGDKTGVRTNPYLIRMINEMLRLGVSVISANYRLTDPKKDVDAAPFPAPMEDGVRLIQCMRTYSLMFNIDPEKIFLGGVSAGANMSIWIALHDDFADPNSPLLEERQSSRVDCVIAMQAQTSNNLLLIKNNLWEGIYDCALYQTFFGVSSREELVNPSLETAMLFIESSALHNISPDDPPVFFLYVGPDLREQLPLPATFLDFRNKYGMDYILAKYGDTFVDGEPVKNQMKYVNAMIHHNFYGQTLLYEYHKAGLRHSEISYPGFNPKTPEEIVAWAMGKLE